MKAHEYVILEIARERERQVQVEGCTSEGDDLYVDGEMACAAFCYGIHGTVWENKLIAPIIALWPWSIGWWKPTGRRRNLVKAAALIVAEIERLDRLTPASKT
jgi:hypothetical protein